MNKKIEISLVIILLIIVSAQTIGTIVYNSATEDEPVYIATGYVQLTKNYFGLETRNPPLIRSIQTIPLLFLNLRFPSLSDEEFKNKYIVGERFLYHNIVSADKILFWSRIPTLFFALILGFFVYLWTKKLYGTNAGILSLFLYSCSPNILAHSGLATNDLGVTLFMFLSLYFFDRFLLKRDFANAILLGISLGGAINSKFTSGVILPIIVLIYLLYWNKKQFRLDIKKILVSIVCVFLVILVAYQFGSVRYFFSGLFITLRDLKIGHDNFFIGEHSKNGWRQFYIVSTLISTPVPVLVLFGVLIIRNVILLPTFRWAQNDNKSKTEIILFASMLLLFIIASLSNKQSHRYILPVYPLLFVALGSLVNYKSKFFKYTCLVISGWLLVATLRIYPYYLDYYNEFIGGPKNGYKYLISDWGQNLNEFKRYWEKENSPYLILGYYGGGQPDHEGISYQDLWTDNCAFHQPVINPVNIKRELLVISHDYLCGQHFETEKKVFKWLENYKPIKRVGYNIFVYDVTTDPKIHENLAGLYYLSGKTELAVRECQRTLLLAPENQVARLILSLVYIQQNNFSQAIAEYLSIKKIELPDLGYIKFACDSYANNLVSLGYRLSESGKLTESIRLYEKVIELTPNSVQGYFGLGVIYQRLVMMNKAIELYTRALNLEPDNVNVRFNLGLIYWTRGDREKARTEFEKVLAIKPDYPAVKQYLK